MCASFWIVANYRIEEFDKFLYFGSVTVLIILSLFIYIYAYSIFVVNRVVYFYEVVKNILFNYS